MTDLTLQKETVALHELIKPVDGAVRTDHTATLYKLLEPMHDALTTVEDKVREVQRALRAAKAVETHDQGTGFFERVSQTCAAAQREVAAVLSHMDALTATCAQMDRYALEWDKSNATYADRMAQQGDGTVTISKNEYDALLARTGAAAVPVSVVMR